MLLRGRKKRIAIAALILPGLLLFVFAIIVPILMSIYLGMTNTVGFSQKSTFIGLANYNKALHDKVFWRSLYNALLLGIAIILIQHPIAIFFAVLLDKVSGKCEKLFRTLLFIPCVLSAMVTTKMWVSIFAPDYGLLDKLLYAFGLEQLIHSWLAEPTPALICVIFIIMWQGFPTGLMIYYAGVKGIPEDLYDAARIDGATEFELRIKIMLPLLRPVIAVNTTMALIGSLKQMETIMLSTNGDPGHMTQFIANYQYIIAFQSQKVGYANSIAVLFVIVCLIVSVINNRITTSESIEY